VRADAARATPGIWSRQPMTNGRSRLRAVMAVMLSLPLLALTASQDAHQTFTVGTASAGRGQRALGVLSVPAGIDAGYDMPVAVIHGARPGPVLAVVSG